MIDENKLIKDLKSWDMQDEYLLIPFLDYIIDFISNYPKFDLNDITEKDVPLKAIENVIIKTGEMPKKQKVFFVPKEIHEFYCPRCQEFIGAYADLSNVIMLSLLERHKYCRNCGQKLKFELKAGD